MSILELVSFLSAVDGWLSYPIFVLSALIIYLSLRVVPPSLSRTYCLNVAVPSFLSTSTYMLIAVLISTGQSIFLTTDGKAIIFLYGFLRGFTLCGYLYFSTLTIFLAFLGYAKPLLFQTLIKTRNIVAVFGFGYVWTAAAVIALFPRLFLVGFLEMSPETDFSVMMIVEIAIALICYLCMLAFYVLAIVRMANRIDRSSSSAVAHWNVLKSVLIYCTPPNIFVALALSGYTCDTVLETSGLLRPSSWNSTEEMTHWLRFDDYCAPIRVWSQALTNLRLFVSVSTALIAFRDYRVPVKNALLKITMRVFKTLRIVDQNYEFSTAPTENSLFTKTAKSVPTQTMPIDRRIMR
ncbi:hypothetical protein QR680_006213 [Steinernema hermaphroditum]|uniref:Uncharacterized protein n=1 Tax=Steinernema hermaphroditum TaxID=289476 RepID=A0AA39HVV0_9BILA|nr:hypothetical protein QR680_006213 [Steinernema hermaphroditum]